MNGAHCDEHESVLHEVLTGDLTANDPRVLAIQTGCPECSARLAELRALSALLDEAAREERETLAGLDRRSNAPGSDRVAPFIRARAAEERLARSVPARHRWPWMAAAAAGVLAAGWLAKLLLEKHTDAQPTVLLGATSAHPHGQVESYLPFTWTRDLKTVAGGHFVVKVFRKESPAEPVLESGLLALDQNQWSPRGQSSLPPHIHWVVQSLDANGVEVDSYADDALLSR